jgi:GMP synthase (glutamine-hydrolysing)
LLAHTFGGSVDYHELGEEKGEVEIRLTEEGKKDPLLGVLPEHFSAYASHFQTVTRLPQNALEMYFAIQWNIKHMAWLYSGVFMN